MEVQNTRSFVSVDLAFSPWVWHWGCHASVVAQLVVACCGDAVGWGASAHWGGTVATEEERVGADNGEAHPRTDEVCHIRVCAAPYLRE